MASRLGRFFRIHFDLGERTLTDEQRRSFTKLSISSGLIAIYSFCHGGALLMSSLNGHADALRKAFDSLISDPRWPVSSTQYPSNMLPLASHEGLARLRECDAQSQDNFVVAARFFVGQGHLQCATASVAICLNIIGCIREKCGTDPVLQPHRHFTADDLMEELRPKLQPRHRWFSCSLTVIHRIAS